MEFTEKRLIELLNVSQQAMNKALKNISYELKKVDGATRPVKHYKLEDLPERYKKKLEEKGIEPNEDKKSNNFSIANFTQKYLLATPKKREQAIAKCKLIEFYIKRDSSLNQRQWLDEILVNSLEFDCLGNVSIKQLNDWLKKYNEAKAKQQNLIEAFIDTRGAKKGAGIRSLTSEQKEIAERYFVKTTRPKMSEVYKNMCHKFGDTMPSYDVLNKYYKEWKRKNPLLYEFSKSPDSAKNKYLVAFGNESAKAKYRNHYWELDSTPADVICDDGKRYSVIAALDVFTRRVVFHVAESSNSYSISQLLRKAILKLGIPENVVIDNGKDYTSNHFQSICLNLGINMNVVAPFSGEKKPHVERIFGSLSRELFEQIQGYIGHNVEQRAELQARKSFKYKIESQRKWREEQKLRTDEDRKAWRDAWKIKKENIGLDLTVLLSPEELQNWIDNWAFKIYEQREHKGIKTKPIEKWNKDLTPVQSIPDERMLCLLLGESVVRRVGKKGISFDGCNYMHLELVELVGHSVSVMASADLGYVYVFDENMKFICIAEDEEFMGQDRAKIKAARKKSLALMKQMDKIVREAEKINDITILDRIEDVRGEIESKTYAVVKRTETVDAVLRDSKNIEQKDKEALEESNRYDFKNKDEEGKPQKVLASGRPAFTSRVERFIWVIENNDWTEKDKELKEKYPESYEIALKEAKIS